MTPPPPPAGGGAAAHRGGAEEDPRGAREAGAGPPAAAEGGAENHPGQREVPPQTLLHTQGRRLRPPLTSTLGAPLMCPFRCPPHDCSPPERSLHFGSVKGNSGWGGGGVGELTCPVRASAAPPGPEEAAASPRPRLPPASPAAPGTHFMFLPAFIFSVGLKPCRRSTAFLACKS